MLLNTAQNLIFFHANGETEVRKSLNFRTKTFQRLKRISKYILSIAQRNKIKLNDNNNNNNEKI